MANKVFIATSLDGYIADKDGKIDWLHEIDNPNQIDMGYGELIQSVDALIMGRTTFETVLGFGIDWPYPKKVFVLSTTLESIPEDLEGKVEIVNGPLKVVLEQINRKGFENLYIDGGKTIQSFLREDLVDEMIITQIPILLGEGFPLFGKLNNTLKFECIDSTIFLNSVVQNKFVRKR